MASITIRNIPDSILEKIRTLSTIEKRSINNELLLLIEAGLNEKSGNITKNENIVPRESQIRMWEQLQGKWEDERSTEEIIDDIYAHRTPGRKVNL